MTAKRWVLVLFSIAGLGVFVHFLLREGPARIWQSLTSISLWFWCVLVLARLGYWVVRTVAWQAALGAIGTPLRFWDLFRAGLAAFTVGYITPLSKVGGEAARVVLTRRAGPEASLAAVVTGKTVEYLAGALLLVAGVALAISRYPMDGRTRLVLGGATLGGVAALALVVARQRRGLVTFVWRVVRKLHPSLAASDTHRGYVEETDRLIRDFYRTHGPVAFRLFWLYLAMYAIWVGEIHLSFLSLGATGVGVERAFLVVILGFVSFLVPSLPGQVGVYEATYLGIFALLGIPLDIGVAMILLRRVLALCCCAVGLPYLFRLKGPAPPDP